MTASATIPVSSAPSSTTASVSCSVSESFSLVAPQLSSSLFHAVSTDIPSNSSSTDLMTTRSKSGIVKPKLPFSLHS